jgi:hypothetical protein
LGRGAEGETPSKQEDTAARPRGALPRVQGGCIWFILMIHVRVGKDIFGKYIDSFHFGQSFGRLMTETSHSSNTK